MFLYLAASAEAVSMVLVAERTEQARQGDTGVPPAKDDGPDHGHGGLAAKPLSEGPNPGHGVRRSLSPEGTQNRWGPKDLA